jgi:hypothetical protein
MHVQADTAITMQPQHVGEGKRTMHPAPRHRSQAVFMRVALAAMAGGEHIPGGEPIPQTCARGQDQCPGKAAIGQYAQRHHPGRGRLANAPLVRQRVKMGDGHGLALRIVRAVPAPDMTTREGFQNRFRPENCGGAA